jgi:hypothetical protein
MCPRSKKTPSSTSSYPGAGSACFLSVFLAQAGLSGERLGERFDDLHFLAFDARLVEAVRRASVPVYERA